MSELWDAWLVQQKAEEEEIPRADFDTTLDKLKRYHLSYYRNLKQEDLPDFTKHMKKRNKFLAIKRIKMTLDHNGKVSSEEYPYEEQQLLGSGSYGSAWVI